MGKKVLLTGDYAVRPQFPRQFILTLHGLGHSRNISTHRRPLRGQLPQGCTRCLYTPVSPMGWHAMRAGEALQRVGVQLTRRVRSLATQRAPFVRSLLVAVGRSQLESAATAWVGALGLTQVLEVTRPSMDFTALGLRPATTRWAEAATTCTGGCCDHVYWWLLRPRVLGLWHLLC